MRKIITYVNLMYLILLSIYKMKALELLNSSKIKILNFIHRDIIRFNMTHHTVLLLVSTAFQQGCIKELTEPQTIPNGPQIKLGRSELNGLVRFGHRQIASGSVRGSGMNCQVQTGPCYNVFCFFGKNNIFCIFQIICFNCI